MYFRTNLAIIVRFSKYLMGRKSIDKDRKDDEGKKAAWSKALFPYLQSHGLQRLSINKIAKYLNLSKSTLYEYFGSKEEIILLAVSQKIDTLLPAIQLLKVEEESFENRYWKFFHYITENSKDISSRFLSELRQLYPTEWKTVTQFLNLLMEEIGAFYTLGMKAGVFRQGSIPLLLEQDRHFIFSILTDDTFLQRHQLSFDQVIRDYLQFKFSGLKL